MKSLLISSAYFPPQTGGISHLMRGIASALGPDLVCCLTGQPLNGVGPHAHAGPRVYRRPAVFNANRRCVRIATWGATIAEIALRERPRITQIATADEGPLGLWLHRWLRLPFVVYAHGNEVLRAMQDGQQKPRFGLQRAHRVLAVSHFTADLVSKVGIPANRIEVVHPGCDTDYFQPRSPRMHVREKLFRDGFSNKIILTVGNLVARKGQDMVIRSLPRLRRSVPGVMYLIVGEGSYRAQLEELATDLGVAAHVKFAGRISAEDLPDIYNLADVFVMPSREQACDVEGFGLVFLEASACGKPVVGGRSGGIADAVLDDITGFIVNPDNPEFIADALARILTNKDLACRLGQQGRAWVVKHFSWAGVGERVQGILQSVLHETSIDKQSPGAFA